MLGYKLVRTVMAGEKEEKQALPAAKSWAAIHAHPRSEKVVAEYLRGRAVPVFLPLRVNRRVYGARVRFSELPLFPGYLFYDSGAVDRQDVFASRRVARILVPDDPRELAADLENLARVAAAEQAPRTCDFGPPGTLVEVIDGPLYGTTGELIRHANGCRLLLRVRFLGFAADVTIEESCVRPLGNAR